MSARRLAGSRRTRAAFWLGVLFLTGIGLEVNFIPHYLAPTTALAYIAAAGGLRLLRYRRRNGVRWGAAAFAAALLLLGAQLTFLYADPAQRSLYDKRDFIWRRSQIVDRLQQAPGKQLVLVRYGPNHSVHEEWIYHRADIDSSRIVWAHSMGPAKDSELVSYYKDRHLWLLEDDGTAKLSEFRGEDHRAMSADHPDEPVRTGR